MNILVVTPVHDCMFYEVTAPRVLHDSASLSLIFTEILCSICTQSLVLLIFSAAFSDGVFSIAATLIVLDLT